MQRCIGLVEMKLHRDRLVAMDQQLLQVVMLDGTNEVEEQMELAEDIMVIPEVIGLVEMELAY